MTRQLEPQRTDFSTFVDDALVNDQLQDYWGKAKIEAWG